jgi:hypothetical protein
MALSLVGASCTGAPGEERGVSREKGRLAAHGPSILPNQTGGRTGPGSAGAHRRADLKPYPYVTPTPDPVATRLDGTYMKIRTLDELGGVGFVPSVTTFSRAAGSRSSTT